MSISDDIRIGIAEAFKKIGVPMDPKSIPLEHPIDLNHGDYSSPIAMQFLGNFAKNANKPYLDNPDVPHVRTGEFGLSVNNFDLPKKPKELAAYLIELLNPIGGVKRIEVAGPGFMNFTLTNEAFAQTIEEARSTDMWGSSSVNADIKTMVEYTDPNPFKEFHIGHLVPNTIGESISRLYQFTGADVRRANYQGDVGRHVARAIWGLLQSGDSPKDVKALGRAYAAGAAADTDGSSAKDEITSINKKVYDRSDEKINQLYDGGRKTSLEHFEDLYKILGTKFDFYFFESEAGPQGKKIVESHINDGIFEKSDGAVIYDGEKKGLHKRVFLNSEGLPTYEAKELALSQMKYEKFPYDTSVIVTGNEINEYFKVLLAAMGDIFPELAAKTRHVSHGMMRFAEGKMSSRTGNVITGESLLEDLTNIAQERASESRADDKELLAQQVAVAAIKFQILKGAASKDIIFERERALSVDGDSGPYLQYAYARTQAIKEKAGNIEAKADVSVMPNMVARLIPRFPEIVMRATEHLEPHIVTTYLVELASAFNAWYAQEQILDGTPAAAHKLAIVEAVGRTLKNGLWILGIPAPEKM